VEGFRSQGDPAGEDPLEECLGREVLGGKEVGQDSGEGTRFQDFDKGLFLGNPFRGVPSQIFRGVKKIAVRPEF